MAADSYGNMYRELRLWVPELPIFLAQKLIRDAYRRIAEKRPWSALRGEGEFLVGAKYSTGTVTVTRNSVTVTGASTVWTSSMIGRQFRVDGRAPIYTIATVPSGTSLTLDRVWGGNTAAGKSYDILDAYVTAPTDFKRFLVVYDPARSWRLWHWITQEELSRLDAARTTAGDPQLLADRRFNSSGVPQYELWPYATGDRNYPFYYIKQAADLVLDEDTPFYPLRGDEIVLRAKRDLCRWPGTREFQNPMFGRTDLFKSFQVDYQDAIDDAEREDESIFLTWLETVSWASMPYAPVDARYLQQHAPWL